MTTKKERFKAQIQAFYEDFNPEKVQQSENLAELYCERQLDLWIALYEVYKIKHTPRHRPYPPAAAVFNLGEVVYGKLVFCVFAVINPSLDKSTIKLGLGDFIFYSVLVGRADLHGFGTFSACLLCIVVVRVIAVYGPGKIQSIA